MNPFQTKALSKDSEGKITSILVDIARGKRYLSDPDHSMVQVAQKRNTCWYYAFNYLRPRYGNKISPDTLNERRIEKCFSNYRKGLTTLDNISSEYNAILNKYSAHHFEKVSAQLMLFKTLTLNEAALFKEFINQNEYSILSDYINNKLLKKKIENCIVLFKSLHLDPHHTIKKYFPSHPISSLNASSLYTLYYISIQNEAATHYGLIPTAWHPRNGIDELINVLNEKGPLSVSGRIGKPYYRKAPHILNEKFGTRNVFGWNRGEYIEQSCGSIIHNVIIIGAKNENDQKYVYFIDPGDISTPGKKGKLYKISYDRLVKSIDNTIGQKFLTNQEGLFGYHADIPRLEYKINYYKFFKEYRESEQNSDYTLDMTTPKIK